MSLRGLGDPAHRTGFHSREEGEYRLTEPTPVDNFTDSGIFLSLRSQGTDLNVHWSQNPVGNIFNAMQYRHSQIQGFQLLQEYRSGCTSQSLSKEDSEHNDYR